MPEQSGFSATNFIKKQYNQNSQKGESEENKPVDPPEQTEEGTASAPSEELKKEDETLNPEAVKGIIKQYIETADTHVKAGRLWESIGLYNACLQLAPQDYSILEKLADVYIKVNSRKEAVDVFTKMASQLEREGKVEDANHIYEKIYGLEPTNSLACSVLGRKPENKLPYAETLFTQHTTEEKKEPVVAETQTPVTHISDPPIVEEFMPLPEIQTKVGHLPPIVGPIVEPKHIPEPPVVQELVPLPEIKVAKVEIKPEIKQEKVESVQIIEPPVIEEAFPLQPAATGVPIIKETKPIPPVVEKKHVDTSAPAMVEELIPFPPMPEKKVEEHAPVASSVVPPAPSVPVHEPVVPVVEEAFPMPLPSNETKVSIEKPVTVASTPPIEAHVTTPEMPIDVLDKIPGAPIITKPVKSANDRMQESLDIIMTDPENIEARLNYINAHLEMGPEFELVDDYLELANCYRQKGQEDNAKKYYRKVLDIDPNVSIAKKYLGEIEKPTVVESAPAKPQSFVVTTTPMPKAMPPVAPVVAAAANNLTKEDSSTVDQLRRLLQINPLNDGIARKLANFYRSKEMHHEAVEELTLLADAYMQRKLYSKASPIYEEIVKEENTDENRKKLAKSKTLIKSMEAINKAITSYKTDLKH